MTQELTAVSEYQVRGAARVMSRQRSEPAAVRCPHLCVSVMSVMTAQYENTSYKQIIPRADQSVHTGQGGVQGQGQPNLMSRQTQCAVSLR